MGELRTLLCVNAVLAARKRLILFVVGLFRVTAIKRALHTRHAAIPVSSDVFNRTGFWEKASKRKLARFCWKYRSTQLSVARLHNVTAREGTRQFPKRHFSPFPLSLHTYIP
jgi:hypothetical protein